MSSMDNANIREVVARFQNSADVLDELRGRLQSLARTDDLHGVSLRAAQVAAQSLEESSGQIKVALDLLRNSLSTADSALTAATAFMKTTDLSEISRQLQSLANSQGSVSNEQARALEDIRLLIGSEFSQIRSELASLRSERSTIQEQLLESSTSLSVARKELEDLRAKVALVPDRARSKYGL